MSRTRLTILGIVIIVLGIVAFSSVFTVHQTRQVLVLQFGEAKRVIQDSRACSSNGRSSRTSSSTKAGFWNSIRRPSR